MKRENTKYYILEFIAIFFFLIILLTSKVSFNKMLIAIFLVLYAYVATKVIGRPKQLSIYRKEVTKYMLTFALIYVALYYVIGIYVGYYKSAYIFGFDTLFKYVIPIIIIIVSSEIIRNQLLECKNKISVANTVILSVVIDLVVYVNIYNLFNIEEFLQALGYIFFASIISNVLYNYTSNKFGIMPNIVYRIVTTIYAYIIPIIPDVYIYFKSVCRMVYPLLIYLVLRSVYEKDKKIEKSASKGIKFATTSVIVIAMAIISMLISCKFTYGMLVIGSGSMTGTLDKGDAIIFRSSNNIKEVKKGDIILFGSGDKIIVHRVVKIEDINDEIRLYTKGDNNVQQDAGYITDKEYKGYVVFKVKQIGQPTIWVNDLFKELKRG